MKNKISIIVGIVIIIIIIGLVIYSTNKDDIKPEEQKYSSSSSEFKNNMDVVLSLEDKINENSIWCGTFNLIWNDLKNDLAKQDIVFNPQPDIVNNLNKGTFTSDNLSENSYYKTYGIPNIELKEKIEKEIKDKFNETSDILNDFDWENASPESYFLYAMLKKEFEFPKVFTELENGDFGNYTNVKYFGINNTTENEVRQQVEVLYYNNPEDFAVRLLTKEADEVIIAKGANGETFGEIYELLKQRDEQYDGNKSFSENDTLKIPNIKIKEKEELDELENKNFQFSNGDEYYIEKALQTIEFEIDKKGGKIKSEAGMMVNKAAIIADEPREFLVDDTFTIFLKEKDKELPYFAARISDISKVQEDVKEKVAESELNEVQNVNLSIKDGTLTNIGATIVITDNNDTPYTYGKWFRIDKKENGKWVELKAINDNYSFEDIGLEIGQDKTLEEKIDWFNLYGQLEKGEYRLVKNIYDDGYKYFSTEFSIK